MTENLDPTAEPLDDSSESGWPVPTAEVMSSIGAQTAAWPEPEQLAGAQP